MYNFKEMPWAIAALPNGIALLLGIFMLLTGTDILGNPVEHYKFVQWTTFISGIIFLFACYKVFNYK